MSPQPKDEIQIWSESAPYWERHFSTIREMFAPVSRALMEDAGVGAGNSVLDVAGGSGEPSLSVAERVSASGRVVYTDPVSGMARAARRHTRSEGLGNIFFCQAVAETLPFGSGGFDAVLCRFGVMFFPDATAGIAEMLRVARSGAWVGAAVWQSSEVNPFHHVIVDVLSRYVPPEPEDPDATGAFRFAESGKLERVFLEAGAGNVVQRLLAFKIEASISVDGFWELRSQLSPTLRDKLASLPADQVHQIAEEVKQAARAFSGNGKISFPAQVIIVRGEKVEEVASDE